LQRCQTDNCCALVHRGTSPVARRRAYVTAIGGHPKPEGPSKITERDPHVFVSDDIACIVACAPTPQQSTRQNQKSSPHAGIKTGSFVALRDG
jgi:hypothetical protein